MGNESKLQAIKSPISFQNNDFFCIFTTFKRLAEIIYHMKEVGKYYYESPAITVVEVKTEGVVCNSPTLEDYIVNPYEEE